MKVVITGIPGSGKTTLAAGLAPLLDLPVVSAGDIGRLISPERLARGEMADSVAMDAAVLRALAEYPPGWILEGFPRTVAQARILPSGCTVINLVVQQSVAIERQLNRARDGDNMDNIMRRTMEQTELLEANVPDGWAYELAGPARTLDTTFVSPSTMVRRVVWYLRGQTEGI